MKRKMEEYLIRWKNAAGEKMPLLLYGARQVGKTYMLTEFGANHYKNTVYLNFETEPALIDLFNDSIDPRKLIPRIERYFRTVISPENTLILFDEIQICNRALASMKYFCELAPEFDLIGAGSLLGVHLSSADFSFPVGKVITKAMHPLSFEEYLWESELSVFADTIDTCFNNNEPIGQELHNRLLDLYKEYLLVGGMPLSVYSNFHHHRILDYKETQRIILDTYTSDMTKYTDKSQSIKTINTYESIVPQLAKDNRKFQYKSIAKGARASLFGESIDWLIRAGAVLKCTKIRDGNNPPHISEDISSFKLYMNDIGLCSYKAGLTAGNMRIFDQTCMGGIVENYIACTLASRDHELFYWESGAKAEVDFIVMINGDVIPVEVKANDNVRSYSLNSYMNQNNPKYAIRVSAKNFGFGNNIKSVPLYAAYLI